MFSGFNHINITLGEDFNLGYPYDVTKQVNKDIFNNNKAAYCTINFPKSAKNTLGFTKSVGVMTFLDSGIYLKSDSIPNIAGTINSTVILEKLFDVGVSQDKVYLIVTATTSSN